MKSYICFTGPTAVIQPKKLVDKEEQLEWGCVAKDDLAEFERTLTLEDEDVSTYLWLSKDNQTELFWEGLEQSEVEHGKSFRHDNAKFVAANVKMNKQYRMFAFEYPSETEVNPLHFELLAAIVFRFFGKPVLADRAKLKLITNTMAAADDNALEFACAHNRVDVIEGLIDRGATASQKCLGYAAMKGHTEVARILLKHGAKANMCDDDGNFPIALACFGMHYDTVELLLENGAYVNARDQHNTPTIVLVCHNEKKPDPALLELLLQHGGDPNAKDYDDDISALSSCAQHGHLECAKLLLKYGANTRCVDVFRQTPVDYAKLNGQTEILKLFEK